MYIFRKRKLGLFISTESLEIFLYDEFQEEVVQKEYEKKGVGYLGCVCMRIFFRNMGRTYVLFSFIKMCPIRQRPLNSIVY